MGFGVANIVTHPLRGVHCRWNTLLYRRDSADVRSAYGPGVFESLWK